MKKIRFFYECDLHCLNKTFRVMRITVFLLLASILQTFANDAYSQKTRLSLDFQGTKLADALDEIENKTEFYFLFNEKLIDINRKVNMSVNNEKIDEILDQLFAETEIVYTITDRKIILAPSFLTENEQQQNSVSGKVTDSSNQPLPGVTVLIKGTNIGTVTNTEGNYSLTGIPDNATLQFTFVGMKGQEITVEDKTTIDVVMIEDAIGLEEVIAIGYGTQKRATITGSVAAIQGEKIVNIPVANVSSTLAGKLPGVVALQRSGLPGGDNTSINIRGFGNALIIVDGVEQDFNQLDPNEIESFSVLKDAAAAIYGSRAANGVILVTTKRGRSVKPTIDFSTNLGWQTRTAWPMMANSGEFTSLINQGRINQSQPLKYTEYDVKVYKYVSGDEEVIETMTPQELERFKTEDLRNYRNEDPYSAAFKDWAPIQQYNLSSRGGNDNLKYFISAGILNQQSMFKSEDAKFNRYNVRGNLDAKITNNLNVSLDFSGRYEQRDYPLAGMDGIMQLTYWGEPTKAKVWPDLTKPVGSIVDAINADLTGYRQYDYQEYNTALAFDYQVPWIKGLSLKGRLDYRAGFYYNNIFGKQYWTYVYDYKTDIYTQATNPSGKTSLTVESRHDDWITGQFFADYNRSFGNHEIKGLFVYEGLSSRSRYLQGYREGYLSTALQILNAGGDLNKNNAGTESEAGRVSYVGRLNYGFANKYLLEGTFRYDGNSIWGEDYRWGFFPSVLIGWRISEENFIKNSASFIDNLKLRGSIGTLGDDKGGIPYQYLATYSINGKYIFNNTIGNGIKNNGIANPYATWAEYTTYNGGLDFSFWKNKLYGEFDLFYRYGYNLLGYRADALPTTFGASFPAENLNSSSNRGFELKLGHQNKIKEFSYDIEGNVSWNRAKWEEYEEKDYSEATPDVKARDQVSGQWQNIIWGYEAVGLFQSQEEIDNWTFNQDGNNNKTLRPGDIKYVDRNNDGKLNKYDEIIIGNNVPLTMFGLSLSANWKGIDFSALFQGAADLWMYDNEERAAAQYEGNTYGYYARDTWTPENTDAKYPRFVPGNSQNNRQSSTFWMHDASYLRLKNLQIGYMLPQKILSVAGVKSCRIYFSGVNIFTLTGMKTFDPEAPIGDLRYYPQQKTYSVGLNLSF